VFLTDKEAITYRECCYFGDVLWIGEKPYRVQVAIDRKKLRIEPAQAEGVPVKLAQAAEQLSMATEDGSRGFMFYKPGATVRIPPGTYRVLSYHSCRKDEQGDVWSTHAVATGEAPTVTVAEGGTSVVPFGEPYTAFAGIPADGYRQFAQAGSTAVPVEFRLVGSTGETVLDLRRISGENTKIPMSAKRTYRAAEPSYKIVKPSGEVVVQGTFQYG
jgi:hypothetical protein